MSLQFGLAMCVSIKPTPKYPSPCYYRWFLPYVNLWKFWEKPYETLHESMICGIMTFKHKQPYNILSNMPPAR